MCRIGLRTSQQHVSHEKTKAQNHAVQSRNFRPRRHADINGPMGLQQMLSKASEEPTARQCDSFDFI